MSIYNFTSISKHYIKALIKVSFDVSGPKVGQTGQFGAKNVEMHVTV